MDLGRVCSKKPYSTTILCLPFLPSFRYCRNVDAPPNFSSRNWLQQPTWLKANCRHNLISPPIHRKRYCRHYLIPRLIISHLLLFPNPTLRSSKLPTCQPPSNPNPHPARMIFSVGLCHPSLNPQQIGRCHSYIRSYPNSILSSLNPPKYSTKPSIFSL